MIYRRNALDNRWERGNYEVCHRNMVQFFLYGNCNWQMTLFLYPRQQVIFCEVGYLDMNVLSKSTFQKVLLDLRTTIAHIFSLSNAIIIVNGTFYILPIFHLCCIFYKKWQMQLIGNLHVRYHFQWSRKKLGPGGESKTIFFLILHTKDYRQLITEINNKYLKTYIFFMIQK